MVRTSWWLVLVLLAPGALAAQGTVDVQSDLPVELRGERSLTADGALLVEGDDGELRLKAHGGAELVRVVHRAFGFVRPGDPTLEVTWSDSVERHRVPLADAFLYLQDRKPGFTLLAQDGSGHVVDTGATTYVGAIREPMLVASEVPSAIAVRIDPPSRDSHYETQLPAGHHRARAGSGSAGMTGAFEAYIADAVLLVQDLEGEHRTIQAHFREERHPGTIYNPIEGSWSGPGQHTEYVHEYVLLRAVAGHLELQFSGIATDIIAEDLRMSGTGSVLLPQSQGTIVVTDDETTTRHEVSGQDLELEGEYDLAASRPMPGYSRTHIDGEGDFTRVAYGAVAAEYDWTTPLVVASLGAVLLAGAAWVLAHSKTALGALGAGLVGGYARVAGDEVLRHEARGELYERVKTNPGTHFQQIADDVEYGASTLNYHLRVLERNGFLTRVRDGRYVRFFDRRSGAYSGDRKIAASALRNPTTAALAQAIVEHPGVAQCDLAQAFGLAPSTINWHVRRLEDAGLVDKRRDSHYMRYYAGDAWATLPSEEQSRHGLLVPA